MSPAPEAHPLESIDLAKLSSGDGMSWKLFVTHAGPIAKAVIRKSLAPAGREAYLSDVLQEFFARLCKDDFRQLKQFNPEKGKLTTWVRLLSARTAIDWLRKWKASEDELPETGSAAELASTDQAPSDISTISLPEGVLSPQQEMILRLCYEDGMEVGDIAATINVKAQTVRSQRHKALEKLRQFLKGRKFF